MTTAPDPSLSEWCAQQLGSAAGSVLFASRQVSRVTGVRLLDGRGVVVKTRPAAQRIRTCVLVQRLLWERGFPCPQPLAGPAPLGDQIATAEAHVPGGEALDVDDAAHVYAETLA